MQIVNQKDIQVKGLVQTVTQKEIQVNKLCKQIQERFAEGEELLQMTRKQSTWLPYNSPNHENQYNRRIVSSFYLQFRYQWTALETKSAMTEWCKGS